MLRLLIKLPLLFVCLGLLVPLTGCPGKPADDTAQAEAAEAAREARLPVVDGRNKLLEKYNFGKESQRISDSVPVSSKSVQEMPENNIPQRERWVLLRTSKGDIKIIVQRSWAPYAADHFIQLVEQGYYNGAPWFRVTDSMAQCGIPADAELAEKYGGAVIPRDPMQGSNRAGTISLAQLDPDSRADQFFINLTDNPQFNGTGADDYYVPFAEVMQGMDVVARLYKTGDPQAGFMERLASEGIAAFRSIHPEGDVVEKAVMMD